MHKEVLVLLTGAIALSISAVPVLASDPPTDDGQYIWQDENGDYWYRNGSEDEYIGEGNYAPDPDSGELMKATMPAGPSRTVILNLIIIMRMAVCGWRMLPEPLILAPEINIILMTTVIFRNIPNQKLIPPPGILQKNPLNQKGVASFICGLGSLLMI